MLDQCGETSGVLDLFTTCTRNVNYRGNNLELFILNCTLKLYILYIMQSLCIADWRT